MSVCVCVCVFVDLYASMFVKPVVVMLNCKPKSTKRISAILFVFRAGVHVLSFLVNKAFFALRLER